MVSINVQTANGTRHKVEIGETGAENNSFSVADSPKKIFSLSNLLSFGSSAAIVLGAKIAGEHITSINADTNMGLISAATIASVTGLNVLCKYYKNAINVSIDKRNKADYGQYVQTKQDEKQEIVDIEGTLPTIEAEINTITKNLAPQLLEFGTQKDEINADKNEILRKTIKEKRITATKTAENDAIKESLAENLKEYQNLLSNKANNNDSVNDAQIALDEIAPKLVELREDIEALKIYNVQIKEAAEQRIAICNEISALYRTDPQNNEKLEKLSKLEGDIGDQISIMQNKHDVEIKKFNDTGELEELKKIETFNLKIIEQVKDEKEAKTRRIHELSDTIKSSKNSLKLNILTLEHSETELEELDGELIAKKLQLQEIIADESKALDMIRSGHETKLKTEKRLLELEENQGKKFEVNSKTKLSDIFNALRFKHRKQAVKMGGYKVSAVKGFVSSLFGSSAGLELGDALEGARETMLEGIKTEPDLTDAGSILDDEDVVVATSSPNFGTPKV